MPTHTSRLADLRRLLSEKEGDGFLIPRTDAYRGEYVAPCDERLAWLTGFTGSAGMAIVLKEKAALFVDGRYTLQARNQVDLNDYEICSLVDDPAYAWIKKQMKEGQKLFYDPWLHTLDDKNHIQKACEAVGASCLPVANLIDGIWADRPPAPFSPVQIHEQPYAGISSKEKRTHIASILQGKKADAALLTLPESIAWLLNIRGNDIPYTPIAQGFALIWSDASLDLFIHPAKISPEVKKHMGDKVRLTDLRSVEDALSRLKDITVLIDPSVTPLALLKPLEKCSLLKGADVCALPKAIKNPAEIAGAKDAHIQDGIAVTRFLAWLSQATQASRITEMDAANQLLFFRQENPLFISPSFHTISASGAHGAIVHYHPTPQTNQDLDLNSLYLVDSGGQYLNGTTDITRTIAIGVPTPEQKDRFTRVLKGHVALATALFPRGTTGSQLDVLARYSLWQAGLDYNHGTGHGVGSYSNVHEGPQRISKGPSLVGLQAGMILSNEPGYYKAGAYGIRLENLVLVVEKGISEDGEQPFFGFETLTQAPIDISLIEEGMLTSEERTWLNTYHRHVRDTLTPYLDEKETAWLLNATKEI